MNPRVTIRDIALRANVHFTTVSMALRNSPKLAQKTRARIQALAEEMGYRPDPILSALNYYRDSQRKHSYQATLGWIYNFAHKSEVANNALLQAYFNGASAKAEKLGFKINPIFLRDPAVKPERLHSILRSRNINGLLIAPQLNNSPDVPLRWEHFSSIKFGHSLKHPKLHTIVPHQYHAMQTMLHELRKLNYRRIGIVIRQDHDTLANRNWQAAFWVDYHSLPQEHRVAPFFFQTEDAKNTAAFRRWFKKEKPEAIGLVGASFISAACSLGLKIPDELGIAICGINNMASYTSTQLTNTTSGAVPFSPAGVYEDWPKVAEVAVDFLISMLSRQETGIPNPPQYLLVEGEWKAGNTLRKQR